MAEDLKGRDMSQETEQSQAPPLCSTGCGFYGSARNNGMCSMCHKGILQERNDSGPVSPPGYPATDCNIRESLLAHCSDSSTVTSPQVTSPADTQSGHSSGKTASATSTEEISTGAKTSVTSERLEIRAAAAGSEHGGACSAGSSGTVSSPQRTALTDSPSGKGKKRKLPEPAENTDVNTASRSEESSELHEETGKTPKAKKKRCFTCKKKVGLTDFDCRCGNMFCSLHRYSDVHNCTYDYKAEAAEKIRKENPVIMGEKIKKI